MDCRPQTIFLMKSDLSPQIYSSAKRVAGCRLCHEKPPVVGGDASPVSSGLGNWHPAPNLALCPLRSVEKQSCLARNYLLLAYLSGKFTVVGLFSIFSFPVTFPTLLTVNVLITKMPINARVLKRMISVQFEALKKAGFSVSQTSQEGLLLPFYTDSSYIFNLFQGEEDHTWCLPGFFSCSGFISYCQLILDFFFFKLWGKSRSCLCCGFRGSNSSRV